MRCKAITRATGERCRLARLIGAGACQKHGGHGHAMRAERRRCDAAGEPFLPLTAVRRPRRALAELGALFGSPDEPSIIERGRSVDRTAGDGS